MIRQRLAPSTERRAISFWRTAARASSKFATFAQAISSNRPTAPSRVSKLVRRPPTIASCSGMTLPLIHESFGMRQANAAKTFGRSCVRSVLACWSVVCGCNRPVMGM